MPTVIVGIFYAMDARRKIIRHQAHSIEGFDFSQHMRQLCVDIISRVEALGHIDMSRVSLGFTQTRRSGAVGMFASLTPLRFAEGRLHTYRRKRRWGIQRIYDAEGREMLYIVTFYLPRFLDLPFQEKLLTTVHELWHIGPKFDGDVRRYKGRCFAHGSSREKYDAKIEVMVKEWQNRNPPPAVYDFMHLNFHELLAQHKRVFGCRLRPPKLIPLD